MSEHPGRLCNRSRRSAAGARAGNCLLIAALLACAGALLASCAPALVGAGAATTAAVAHDRRTPGTMIDDQLIEWKARAALGEDQELWSQSHINVTSFNNIVLLTGETPSERMRTRAAEIVREVERVRGVHNELQIAAPSSMLSRSSDSWITGKVKSSMLADGSVPGTRVKVVTEAGTVYLMGLVTREEAEAATEIARKVNGVQRVVKLFEYLEG